MNTHRWLLAALLLLALTLQARAAELHVMISGALTEAYTLLTP